MKIKKTLRYDCNCCLNNRNYCPIQSVVLQIKADIRKGSGWGAHIQLTIVK